MKKAQFDLGDAIVLALIIGGAVYFLKNPNFFLGEKLKVDDTKK